MLLVSLAHSFDAAPPLALCVAAVTSWGDSELARVIVFAERLIALPFQEWLTIGRGEIAHPERAARRAATLTILEAAVAAHGLGIAAWSARDIVETSICLATCGASSWTAPQRRFMAAAHGAAEAAALALLARDVLAPTDVATLCAPFEHLVSREEIGRLPSPRDS